MTLAQAGDVIVDAAVRLGVLVLAALIGATWAWSEGKNAGRQEHAVRALNAITDRGGCP